MTSVADKRNGSIRSRRSSGCPRCAKNAALDHQPVKVFDRLPHGFVILEHLAGERHIDPAGALFSVGGTARLCVIAQIDLVAPTPQGQQRHHQPCRSCIPENFGVQRIQSMAFPPLSRGTVAVPGTAVTPPAPSLVSRSMVTGEPMGYTLGQAARAAGRSKTTLNRAIKTGKLSAVRGEDGSYTIDAAELQRVYPLTGSGNGHMVRSVTVGPAAVTANGADWERVLPQQLLAERERLVEEQAAAIRDLRQRLDESETERRRVQAQLTALLTDQRPAPPPSTAWGRFLAWRRWP